MSKQQGPFLPLLAKRSFARTWKVLDFHENNLRTTQRTDPDLPIWDSVMAPFVLLQWTSPRLSDFHVTRCLFAYFVVPCWYSQPSTLTAPSLGRLKHSHPSISHIVNAVRNPYLPPPARFMFSRSSMLIYTRMYFSCRFDHHAFCGSSPASSILASQDNWYVSSHSNITLSEGLVPSLVASKGHSHVWKSHGHSVHYHTLDPAQKTDW